MTGETDTVALARAVRRDVLEMTHRGGSSHIGSVYSIADILAVLYGAVLRHDPARPDWPDRDRFILSKGHAGAGVYAVLAERGFFPAALLERHGQDGSVLSGHVSHEGVPGVELSTGALGHGLGVGAGMALAARLDRRANRVVVLLGDGECDEGSVWEAALFAAHHRLDHLLAIVDHNGLQSIDTVERTLGLAPFADKWASFGWAVREVDGHDHAALARVLGSLPFEPGRPGCLICHTVKGKGVSFMEHSVAWHYRSPQGDDHAAARRELEA
jgi:transketolase